MPCRKLKCRSHPVAEAGLANVMSVSATSLADPLSEPPLMAAGFRPAFAPPAPVKLTLPPVDTAVEVPGD